MIQINITGADAAVTQTETLTAGRVGLECGFTFDSAWDGLSKIAVCEGAETKAVIMEPDSDTIIVPWECLADPGYKLRVGVRGENSSGDIVIPTVWARVGKISDSPGDDIDPGQEATPSVVQQIQETAANALYIARGVKAEADSGAFNGEKGDKGDTGDTGPTPAFSVGTVTTGAAGSSAAATITGTTEAPVLNLTIPQGDKGDKGDTGDPGVYIGASAPTDPSVSVWIDTDGGSDPVVEEIFWAQVFYTSYADLQAAFQAGKCILARDSVPNVFICVQYTDGEFLFSCVLYDTFFEDTIAAKYVACTSTGWGGEEIRYLNSNYNDMANRPQINSVTLAGNKSASDLGLATPTEEVTNTSTGAVSLSLDAETIYHFTGSLTSLTITALNTPATGKISHYHFDFDSGSTAATLTLPNTVVMPSDFAVEANKHYEVDILNNYGVAVAW